MNSSSNSATFYVQSLFDFMNKDEIEKGMNKKQPMHMSGPVDKD